MDQKYEEEVRIKPGKLGDLWRRSVSSSCRPVSGGCCCLVSSIASSLTRRSDGRGPWLSRSGQWGRSPWLAGTLGDGGSIVSLTGLCPKMGFTTCLRKFVKRKIYLENFVKWKSIEQDWKFNLAMGANKIYCAHRDILCVHAELYEKTQQFFIF
jgi:hypothetical protein